jgi:NTE family protein
VLPLLLLLLAGCVAPRVPTNQPLAIGEDGEPAYLSNYGLGRYVSDIVHEHPHIGSAGADNLILVTFSGGGKRSAAFAHGALRGLRAIPLHRPDASPRSMLDAVDYIAGVSGGSFPAAHFGLHRDRSFATFGEEFLYVDVNAYIYGIYLLPWRWGWLADRRTGTNDYMAEVYDRLMFRGATFADLARHGRPIVSINATDLANGVTFPMLGVNFGLLCSDLNSFPLARAVAASNGFPVLFSPISLRSYAERCGGKRPPLAAAPGFPENEGAAARRAVLARLHEVYADPRQTRWVHLMDGGIADNLALRGMLNFLLVLQTDDQLFHRLALGTRRILVLSVDGEAAPPRELGLQPSAGGLFTVLSAASGTQIDAYNFETLALVQDQLRHFADRVRDVRCAASPMISGRPCGDVRGDFVHLSLNNIDDAAVRARLAAIPTGLTIPAADVDALVANGEALVRDNATIRAVAADADIVPPGGPVLGPAPARPQPGTGAAPRRNPRVSQPVTGSAQ